LPPPPDWLIPSYLKPKLPEQHLQLWVTQRHRWEKFLHPLAVPPPTAIELDVQCMARTQAPAPHLEPWPYPFSPGCENQYL
jgi:hypothetical protein